MKVVYAPRALRDLYDIESYLGERGQQGKRSVLAAIKSTIEQLERFPRIGVPLDAESRYRLPVARYPYLVFYRTSDDEILILHIRHGARKPIEPEEL